MQRLVANEAFPYAGRNLAKGEEFEASEADARILKFIRRANDAPQPKPAAVVQTAAMKSEGGELFQEQGKPKRGRYRRTDMRSED